MTSGKIEKFVETYAEKRPIYESFTNKLCGLIEDLLRTHNISVAQVEHRTKTTKSFRDKLQREGKTYDKPLAEVTDLCGIRIIAYYLEDVEKIGEMIKKEFKVDEANSVDKAEAADPDRFGYVSVHYVVSLPASRKKLSEWKHCSKLMAEIQVRTVLQHAWSVIDHKLRYKAAREVPRDLRRQLFRLSALLELADSEFSSLREDSEKLEAEYSVGVEKGEYDIELNLDSLNAYLDTSEQTIKWQKIALELGFEEWVPEPHDASLVRAHGRGFLLELLQSSGVKTIHEFDELLQDANTWGKDTLTRLRRVSIKKGWMPLAVPIDVLMILTYYGQRKSITSSMIEDIPYIDPLKEAIIEVIGFRKAKPRK